MTALFDLTPALHIMLMGIVLASGPLAWVWLRHRGAPTQQRVRALTLLTLFLTFDLVVFGAFTRLSDSGLGCPDWPGCYGHASPVGAQAHIEAAQMAMPTGPVTHSKAWIEMIHRYLATLVGVLILVLAIAAWRTPRPSSIAAPSPWWPTLTLFWVGLQGAFGALTVTMKLFPAIVTLHLMGGLVLLVLLCLQALRHNAESEARAERSTVSLTTPLQINRLGTVLWISAFALAVQIALGAWVSTNYAVLACTDFPLCQSSAWPAMNFSEGFTMWRELGMTSEGLPISFTALTAIHYAHRLMAYVVFIVLVVLAWSLFKVTALRQTARWLAALTTLQVLSGLSNVLFGWPLLAALAHTAGAAALVLALTLATVRVRELRVANFSANPIDSRTLA